MGIHAIFLDQILTNTCLYLEQFWGSRISEEFEMGSEDVKVVMT